MPSLIPEIGCQNTILRILWLCSAPWSLHSGKYIQAWMRLRDRSLWPWVWDQAKILLHFGKNDNTAPRTHFKKPSGKKYVGLRTVFLCKRDYGPVEARDQRHMVVKHRHLPQRRRRDHLFGLAFKQR